MDWEITHNELKKAVIISVTGKIVNEELTQMAIEGVTFAGEIKCTKCLIDYTAVEASDDIFDTFEFMTHLDDLGLQHSDKVAVLYNTDVDYHKFAETVAYNRGWSNIMYFMNAEQAWQWLEEQ